MLNRRILRIKVMQALYAFFQHEHGDKAQFEKELFKSLNKIQELYFYILALLIDIHHTALVNIEENKSKLRPSMQDLNPNMKFVNNLLLTSLSKNSPLQIQLQSKKISWQNDMDLVKKLFSEIKLLPIYKEYMESNDSGALHDRTFLIHFIEVFLLENELLKSFFEEKNIHWADDHVVAFASVIKTFHEFKGDFHLPPLLKDEEDDKNFMSLLFNKTILHRATFESLIDKHVSNWEIERIANMDMLLMEMALAEILHIPTVPVKASLNEYIDISKEYSSPNSKVFVNGVLDKIIAELKAENKIQKIGRGLKEN